MTLIDAHCHLANLNELLPLEPLLAEAKEHGITKFLSAALRKSEVEYYLSHPCEEILFSAGIHPNFPPCDLELSDIEKLCADKSIWAIGEIGLDRNNPDLKGQMELFIRQLELAETYKLPVVLHIVGHQVQAYEILRRHPLRYLVHGYAGSIEGFSLLSRLDSFFTISERIVRSDKTELLQAMVAHGSYLFESDITQYYVEQHESNPLLRLLGLISSTAELSGVSRAVLEQVQSSAYIDLTADSDEQ